MESFSHNGAAHDARSGEVLSTPQTETMPPQPPGAALIAVYDNLTSSPRVERITRDSARDLIEELATRTYQISHEAGGKVPYMVIREIVENFIHAGFDEVVVSVLDGGNTLRFADQGPGIQDKERAFLPGFTTATDTMKHVIKGVGSGLPVARECLTFSEGTIEVDDNLGTGTVVTLRVSPPPEVIPVAAVSTPTPLRVGPPLLDLSVRHKKVLSLVMEVGSLGPSLIARELGVGLSTAYRDLEHLAEIGLVEADISGKRVLTEEGIQCLDALFGR
ncbi:MAG: ATP-binding protein [Coriobacteriia bacterium]